MARLIDAEKLDEDLCEILRKAEYDNNCGTFYIFVSEMNDCINDQPTVDAVEVVHGEWIVQNSAYTRFKCSACGSENHEYRWKYCPNCGAKMDGDKG